MFSEGIDATATGFFLKSTEASGDEALSEDRVGVLEYGIRNIRYGPKRRLSNDAGARTGYPTTATTVRAGSTVWSGLASPGMRRHC